METNAPTGEKPQAGYGETLYDLPSPYIPHPVFGLLHLPRFLAKIRKHLAEELPKTYQRNFTKGFDGFLCLHLGIEPKTVIEAVRESPTEEVLTERLRALFPQDLRIAKWNREIVQKGLSVMGREAIAAAKAKMGIAHREDLLTFADMIDFDEGRIP